MPTPYLDNKEFERCIVAYREQPDNKERQNALAVQFYLLATNIVKGFKFARVEPEDAIQDCVMLCFAKIHRFDPSKGKAFNFCTTMIMNQCKQEYRSAQRRDENKIKFAKHLGPNIPRN